MAPIKHPQEFLQAMTKELKNQVKLENQIMNIKNPKQGRLEELKNEVAFRGFMERMCTDGLSVFSLKGGASINLRYDVERKTRDVDVNFQTELLNVKTPEDFAKAVIKDSLVQKLNQDKGDFFTFKVEQIDYEKGKSKGEDNSRANIGCYVGKKLFTSFHLDIGVNDTPFETKMESSYLFNSSENPTEIRESRIKFWETMNDFLKKPDEGTHLYKHEFETTSLEQQFAEKIHTYTKPMGNRTNSRHKDLTDLVIFIQSGDLDKNKLKDAIKHVFEVRDTHQIPETLSQPPENWKIPFEKTMETLDASSPEMDLKMTLNKAFELVDDLSKEIGLVNSNKITNSLQKLPESKNRTQILLEKTNSMKQDIESPAMG